MSVYITEWILRITHDEGLVVVLKLRKSTAGGIRSHG